MIYLRLYLMLRSNVNELTNQSPKKTDYLIIQHFSCVRFFQFALKLKPKFMYVAWFYFYSYNTVIGMTTRNFSQFSRIICTAQLVALPNIYIKGTIWLEVTIQYIISIASKLRFKIIFRNFCRLESIQITGGYPLLRKLYFSSIRSNIPYCHKVHIIFVNTELPEHM